MVRVFQLGETFTITNLDYNVSGEKWVVSEVAYPTITFSCTKYYVVDLAHLHYSSTETVIGNVVKDDGAEVIIAFSQYSGMEVGVAVVGNRMTYLLKLDLPKSA
jgi:hypothetical protein